MFGSDWESLVYQAQINKTQMQTTYINNIDMDQNYSGLIPRVIHSLYKEMGNPEYSGKNFAVYCSFLQIYNEKIFDLLQVKIA
jgi:Kinesin motor domain